MDIENMNIEKATERCKALTNPEQGCWIGISNQKAIETVLSELEKKEAIINEIARYIDKITEEIAREKGVEDFEFCDKKCTDKDEYIDCKDCIKEYFTKKATDNVGE